MSERFESKLVDRKRKQCYIFRVFNRYPPVAQLVEQLPFKEMVAGSIPAGRTRQKTAQTCCFFVRGRDGVVFCELAKPRVGVAEICERRRADYL